MKTLITRSNPSGTALSVLIKNQDFVFGDFYSTFPSSNSSALAHEILKFCLDENIEQIFPSSLIELHTLAGAKVLFEEFGIELIISESFKVENFAFPDAQVDSFTALSSELLALGYPNQKLAIGRADFSGNILEIDDNVKNFQQVWMQLQSISFIQLGKLFNQQEFEALSIFKIEDSVQQNYVLIQNQNLQFFKPLAQDVIHQIEQIVKRKKLKGFFEFDYNNQKILRFKNAAI